MASEDRGPLLYAYTPIPANPMAVAVVLLLAVVTLVLGPLAAYPEGLWPLSGICFVPLGLVLLVILVSKPSGTYVFENGIEISLPFWRRLLGQPRYLMWSEVRDIYPRSYEVAGSFMSPFASSAGTLVHTGLGIDMADGRHYLVRFTPGAIRAFRSESRGFSEAMMVIRDRFARHGESMVTTAKSHSDAEILSLQARAREPLVSISGVFLAFFLPPAIVGTALLAATYAGMALTTPILVAALASALVPPAASMLVTLRRSEARNAILSELSKFQESLREQARTP